MQAASHGGRSAAANGSFGVARRQGPRRNDSGPGETPVVGGEVAPCWGRFGAAKARCERPDAPVRYPPAYSSDSSSGSTTLGRAAAFFAFAFAFFSWRLSFGLGALAGNFNVQRSASAASIFKMSTSTVISTCT